MSQGASLPPSRLSGESSGHPPVSPPVTYAHGRTPPSSRARHFTTQAFVHGPYTVRARRVLVRHHLAVPTALYRWLDRAQNHQPEQGGRRLLGKGLAPNQVSSPRQPSLPKAHGGVALSGGAPSLLPTRSSKSSRPRLTRTLSAATYVRETAGKESGRRPRKSRWARRQRPSQRTTLCEASAIHAGRRPRCCRLDASRRVAIVRDASRYWSLLILITPRTPCVSPQSIILTDDGTYPVRTSTRAQSVSMTTHTRRMR